MIEIKLPNSIEAKIRNSLFFVDLGKLDDGFKIVFICPENPEFNFSYDIYYDNIRADQKLYGHGLNEEQIYNLSSCVTDYFRTLNRGCKEHNVKHILNNFLERYWTFRKEFHQFFTLYPAL